MGKLVEIICLVICLAAMTFTIITFAAPWWIETEVGGTKTSIGLFQTCIKIGDGDWTCGSFSTTFWTSEHKATVAMMVIAIVANVATLVTACMALCGDLSIKAAAGLSALSGVLALIGLIVFITDYTDLAGIDTIDIVGWAYWLAAVSAGAHLANCIITFLLDCISCC